MRKCALFKFDMTFDIWSLNSYPHIYASLPVQQYSSIAMTESSQAGSGLPLNVRPTHYDLTILTDLESLTFKGGVTIE